MNRVASSTGGLKKIPPRQGYLDHFAESKVMRPHRLGMALAVVTSMGTLTPVASACSPNPQLLYRYIGMKPVPTALVNMNPIENAPTDNCEDFFGVIKIAGIQFSRSGAVLRSFYFIDAKGTQWSVPTNIGALSDAARGQANSFVRVGQRYYAHIEACGSGGFASLISLYSLNSRFGAFSGASQTGR